MPNKKSNPIISALGAIAGKIGDWIDRCLNWLINTRIIKRRSLRRANHQRFCA